MRTASVLLFLITLPGSAFGQATDAEGILSMDVPRLAVPEAISCSTSPFGGTLVVGGEQEIFVGVNNQGFAFGYEANPLTQARAWGSNSPSSRRNQSTVAGNFAGGTTPFVAAGSINSADSLAYIEVANASASGAFGNPWKSAAAFDRIQLARGNVDGSSNGSDEIIGAHRWGSRLLVGLWLTGAGGGIAAGNGTYHGIYWSTEQNRDIVEFLAVATGDFNLDKKDDIAIAFRDKGDNVQILVLGYKLGVNISTATSQRINLEVLAFTTFFPTSGVRQVRLGTGDINGDRKPDIVVSCGVDINDEELIKQVHTRAYKLSGTPGAYQLDLISTLSMLSVNCTEIAMTVGDTDGDGRAEVVLGYTLYETDTFYVRTYNAEQATMVQQNVYQTSSNPRPTETNPSADHQYLSLATGDTDKDGKQDIIVAFRDQAMNRLYIKHLEDQSAPGAGISFIADYQHGYANPTFVQASLADWNNDSVIAQYEAIAGTSLQCQQVVEPQILMAAFAPPYWKKLQSLGSKTAFIADTTSQTTLNATGLTSRNSHSVSGYVGASVGGQVFGIGAEATVKATGGYEYASTTGKEQGAETGTAITQGWESSGTDDAMIVYEQERYNCYNYGMKQNGAAVDGNMRFCLYVSRDQLAPSVNSWETVEGSSGIPSWVPVARDWASLALFRSASVSQSSTGFGGVAARAVDGDTNGDWGGNSVTHTNSQAQPWWQVDLGQVKNITKIRLWNRTDCCAERLFNLYVFVSRIPFPSNNPTVLAADSNVRTYRHTGSVKESLSFLTRQGGGSPVQGRYVRVQLAGTGFLSLAEVQVFGDNHLDPDRHPVSLTLLDAATGAFKVSIWDPVGSTFRDVKMRGRLLFNGTSTGKNIWATTIIGSGGSVRSWSLSSTSNTFNTITKSTEHTFRVGAEFDFQAGVVGKVVAGGAYEFSSGVNESLTKTISWGNAFELGGSVAGFDPAFSTGVFTGCNYGAQPYSYEVTEASPAGYTHKFLVVDYIVPDSKLIRSNWNSFGICRAPELTNTLYMPVVRSQ